MITEEFPKIDEKYRPIAIEISIKDCTAVRCVDCFLIMDDYRCFALVMNEGRIGIAREYISLLDKIKNGEASK
jgi:hypothetical protein